LGGLREKEDMHVVEWTLGMQKCGFP
jgi:hypothetical protein